MDRSAVPKVCSKDPLGIRDQLPGDPWIHFCNGHCKVYLLFN